MSRPHHLSARSPPSRGGLWEAEGENCAVFRRGARWERRRSPPCPGRGAALSAATTPGCGRCDRIGPHELAIGGIDVAAVRDLGNVRPHSLLAVPTVDEEDAKRAPG